MGHVYATLAEFKAFLSGGAVGEERDDSLLTLLESASRAVDGYCSRGSQFGPVVETRTYRSGDRGFGAAIDTPWPWPRPSSSRRLFLNCDVVSITTVTVGTTQLDPSAYTLDGRILDGPFGSNTVTVEMVTGYPVEIVATGGALDAALSESDGSATVDDGTKFTAGMMLPVGDEQIQVLAVSGETLTILRGANGTTAASHADETPLSRYRYASEVIDATMRVAQRRWKSRDSGISGSFEGVGIPGGIHLDTERSILRTTLRHLTYGWAA